MTNRDDLLYRVMAANPLPNEHPLPDGLEDWRPPMAILTGEDPVVDAPDPPPVLPMAETGDELLSTERSRNMDTQQRPEVQDTTPRSGWRTAAIAFAAIILVVGAVAGVAALIVNDSDETGSELPEEAAQLLDDYRDAWVNQDVETFYASITDDYFFREYYYGAATQTLWTDWVVEASGTPAEAARDMEFDKPIELIEVRDVVVAGDGPWIVTANEIWEREGGIRFQWDGNFTRVIVEDAGTMKIASVLFAGTITEAEN